MAGVTQQERQEAVSAPRFLPEGLIPPRSPAASPRTRPFDRKQEASGLVGVSVPGRLMTPTALC